MPITWPAGVPADPLAQSVQEAAPELMLRSAMDAGPAKQRRRFTANVRPLRFTVPMTRAQAATFDAWFLATLQGGALAFDLTHPRTLATVSARFTEPPAYAFEPGGTTLQVSCSLEVLP
jgi:hypothetical protein